MLTSKLMTKDDYENYYTNQIGRGLNYYHGERFQRGYGFFGRFLSRYAIPVLKFLGKEAFRTGVDVIKDVSQGTTVKKSFKNRLKERGKSLIDKVFDESTSQKGSGIKRKSNTLSILKNKRFKTVMRRRKRTVAKRLKKRKNQFRKANRSFKKKPLKKKQRKRYRKKESSTESALNYLD